MGICLGQGVGGRRRSSIGRWPAGFCHRACRGWYFENNNQLASVEERIEPSFHELCGIGGSCGLFDGSFSRTMSRGEEGGE